MGAYRTAYVYVRNTLAGILKETDSGYSFIYEEEINHILEQYSAKIEL